MGIKANNVFCTNIDLVSKVKVNIASVTQYTFLPYIIEPYEVHWKSIIFDIVEIVINQINWPGPIEQHAEQDTLAIRMAPSDERQSWGEHKAQSCKIYLLCM